MAKNTTIQLLTKEQSSSTDVSTYPLALGEPLFDAKDEVLYIGSPTSSDTNRKVPIGASVYILPLDSSLPSIDANKSCSMPANTTKDGNVLSTTASTSVRVKRGDICICKSTINSAAGSISAHYSYTAYVCNSTNWEAMDGNYSADNVFTSRNITLAGTYASIGNYSKGKVINAGTSLQTLLTGLLQTTLQPSITDPTATISATGSQDYYEVGTSYTLPTATLTVTTGSYTYGPETGVKFPTYSEGGGAFTGVKLAYGADPDAESAVYTTNASDLGNNGSVNLAPSAYNNKVTTALYTDSNVSYTFSGKAYHTEGVIANDNLNQPSNPIKRISADTVAVDDETVVFRGFRYMYAGGSTAEVIDSAVIRSLSSKRKHTSKPSTSNYFSFTAAKGDTKVIFAFPAGRMGVSSPKFEIFTLAWGATEGFVKSTAQVADARGNDGYYTYDVYTYTPAGPLEAEVTNYRVYFE